MAQTIQINASYVNGNKLDSPKTLYAPVAQTVIRPYTYSAGSATRGDNTMNSVISVRESRSERVYYSTQTVASLVSAANA